MEGGAILAFVGDLDEQTAPVDGCMTQNRDASVWHGSCSRVSPADLKEEDPMSAEEADKSLKQELEDARDDLQRTADEIKVKLHLAGMDAKDAWEEVQPKLAEFEHLFDAKAGEVGEELKALGKEIKQRLLNIKAKLIE
jgi:hypothetical protein